MQKVNNKGFSMVEILISIAIFVVLMVPIVSGIISSMKSTTNAKDLQYRNEYAENIVEYVKQDSLENILKGDYFQTIGSYDNDTSAVFYYDGSMPSYDSSLDKYVDIITNAGTNPTKFSSTTSGHTTGFGSRLTYYPYEEYMISGKVNLGSKDKTYSYKMQISNEYYAMKEKDGAGTYVNPNNLALGVVEDIDYTKVALINGTIANYDDAVSNAFLTKKVEVLKEKDKAWYDVYKNQTQLNSSLFPNDTASRIITVKVSGKAEDGYKVVCSLKYYDNGESNATVKAALEDYAIEYVPFEYNYPVDPATNVATLPSIYLMYNVCLYNGQFSKDDYIVLDTTELNDDAKVDFFIVQTAETYSTNLREANADLAATDSTDLEGNVVHKTLYNNNLEVDVVKREHVAVHLGTATNSKNLSNVSIYHNFDDGTNTDINKKSTNILYSDDTPGFYTEDFPLGKYQPLVNHISGTSDIDFSTSVLRVASLDEAQQESRGLYQVKLWMEETDNPDDIDTTKNPIMTATKGGDES